MTTVSTSLPSPKTWDVVVNPVSGTGAGPEFVQDNVLPLLTALGHKYRLHSTTSVRDAGRIGREILQNSVQGEANQVHNVIVAAGDGTTQELIEGLFACGEDVGKWNISVVPMGTANALHSTLFVPQSPPVPVPSFLEPYLSSSQETRRALSSLILALSDAEPRPLPITLTRMLDNDPASSNGRPPIPSHIVLSTSLHAALLADSEALREKIPGLERFKVAAAQNISVFFHADVHLIPGPNGVQQWDPVTRQWSKPFTADGEVPGSAGRVSLQGPFTYLVSATTTPRLEPTFVIVPTLVAPGAGTMDIVIERPRRDPRVRKITGDEEAAGKSWAPRAMEVFGAAYREGQHMNLLYADGDGPALDVQAVSSPQKEAVVVETFRCKGFRWTPTDADPKAHIVCADGSLYNVPKGGSAEAEVMDARKGGFWVWG